jgi:hypothetical protein
VVVCLPETVEELLVADLAVAVDVVVLHESLEFDLLGEETTLIQNG